MRVFVGNHVVCRAQYKMDFSVIYYPAHKMKADVNVFCAHVILVIFGECDGRLVV